MPDLSDTPEYKAIVRNVRSGAMTVDEATDIVLGMMVERIRWYRVYDPNLRLVHDSDTSDPD